MHLVQCVLFQIFPHLVFSTCVNYAYMFFAQFLDYLIMVGTARCLLIFGKSLLFLYILHFIATVLVALVRLN